ncbi:MAG: alpha-2-macroglobulin family protein [Bacteroidia bacterium]
MVQQGNLGKVKLRKNLQETAFFYPQLRTDAAGNVILRFTMPEALTRWKLLTLAHTRDLRGSPVRRGRHPEGPHDPAKRPSVLQGG